MRHITNTLYMWHVSRGPWKHGRTAQNQVGQTRIGLLSVPSNLEEMISASTSGGVDREEGTF